MPCMATIVPTPLTPVVTNGICTPPVLTYELRASAAELPVIDCTKGVKDAWLSRAWLVRCNACLRRYKRAVTIAHMVGTIAGTVALFAPARVGGLCGIAACVLNFPGSIVGLLVLRFDMVKVILRTYDFWYLSVMNGVAMVLTMVLFADARSLSLLPAMLGFEITILIDANYRAVKTTMRASAVSGMILCSFMVVSLLGLSYATTNVPIFSYGVRSVSLVDGIANCLSTVVLMLWRNALRKYLALDGSSASVRCITYRCRVRLCVAGYTAIEGLSVAKKVLVRENSNLVRLSTPTAQLQFVQSSEVFHPTHTLFQRVYKPGVGQLHRISRWVLHAASIVGITTTVLAFLTTNTTHVESLCVASASSTMLFCTIYAAHAQRRLLHLLSISFDFVFVSSQLSVACACVCDALHWDVRCLSVLSCWLWIHWVLTIDTVTPVMRVRLGYTRLLVALVLALFIAAHVVLSLELIVWNRLALQDRAVVATTIGRHFVQVRVIPVLFGRMVTTLLWSCRLLGRLLQRSKEELLMIQGSVMYHDYERERRRTKSSIGRSIRSRS